MEIVLKASMNGLKSIEEMIRFSQNDARVCYSEKDYDELEKEQYNAALIERIIKSGHHSVFGHMQLKFYMKEIPKALAMVLNNEGDYETSEKSARFTRMADVEQSQGAKYEKWMDILVPLIDKIYPKQGDEEARKTAIKKLGQENARYMTSAFTPTRMTHTLSLRQLNFLIHEFEDFAKQEYKKGSFKGRIAQFMKDFNLQTSAYKVEGLRNQTGRHLSFFNDRTATEHFGDVYSTHYLLSFAGLGQAHRHRTLSYNVSGGSELGAHLGFFVPKIIEERDDLYSEWYKDLKEVAVNDFPQAQLLLVNERGTIEDFRSKVILRLCGHAQYEIMEKTKEIAKKYSDKVPEVREWLSTKCSQGMPCSEPCVWGAKRALERIV